MTRTYSKKLREKILHPKYAGKVTQVQDGERLVIGEEGSVEGGNAIRLFLLVSESDGLILNAKYQLFGGPALLGAAEVLCELLIHKNYDQARRITADLIDTTVREKTDESAFPTDSHTQINYLLDALDRAIADCTGIPLPSGYTATPVDLSALEVGEYVDWQALTHDERLALINDIIARTVLPYIQLDEGGVEVISLTELDLLIKYSGSCTTCYSSTTSTLSAIQQILRAKVHPSLTVTPVLT